MVSGCFAFADAMVKIFFQGMLGYPLPKLFFLFCPENNEIFSNISWNLPRNRLD
jgi:hypothetical protein